MTLFYPRYSHIFPRHHGWDIGAGAAQERMKWDSSAFKAYEVSEVAGKKSVQRLGGFHKEGHQWGYDNITYIYTIIYIYVFIYI